VVEHSNERGTVMKTYFTLLLFILMLVGCTIPAYRLSKQEEPPKASKDIVIKLTGISSTGYFFGTPADAVKKFDPEKTK
jgi:uncharacterized lipoprotein YajG